jgi:hypothetical protein
MFDKHTTIRLMWKNLRFLTVATLAARNANEVMAAPLMDLAVSAFSGSLESGGRIFLCVESVCSMYWNSINLNNIHVITFSE